jgi:hypothetical protein
LILLAVLLALAVLAVGSGVAWYHASSLAAVAAAVIAVGVVAAGFALRPDPPSRGGIAVGVDDSCDSVPVTRSLADRLRAELAPGIDGDAAVVVGWFADNARSSRRVVLDLTDEPPAGVRGDAVRYANWKAPRAQTAREAIATIETRPCARVGTSVVGAAVAANDLLSDAGIEGTRRIVLVTNLIEFSSALKLNFRKFKADDVPAAVDAIRALPARLRPRLGRSTDVHILFTPVVRVDGRYVPLPEDTAVALETWAERVFADVLKASTVRVEIVSRPA